MSGGEQVLLESSDSHPRALPFGSNIAVPWVDVATHFTDWTVHSSMGDCESSGSNVSLRSVLEKLVRVFGKLSTNCWTSAGVVWRFLAESGCTVKLYDGCFGPDTNE